MSRPVNQAYAAKFGFEYRSDVSQLCSNPRFEKLTYLDQLLATLADGDRVIWLDADALVVSKTDIHSQNPELGMVRLYAGRNQMEPTNQYNAGVIFMQNTATNRALIKEALSGGYERDEMAFYTLFKTGRYTVTAMSPAYNCWANNRQQVTTPEIIAFHDIPAAGGGKITAMQAAIAAL